MSYILDALRRAESERERGEVPGLHAQAEPAGLGEAAPAQRGSLAWMALGGAVFAGVLVFVGWWVARPPGTVVATDAPAAPSSPLQAALPVPTAAASAAASAAAGPPLLVAPAVPATPSPSASPLAAAAADVRAAPPPRRAASAAEPAPRRGSGPAPGAPPGSAGSPTPLAELPPAQRAELPQMQIGGAIYSDQPASRFVVINGLVVREGETAAPGVVLERIAPKSAVIRWRDMKIELPI